MTYTAYVERANGELATFENAQDVMELPTDDVTVETASGERETIPGADIIRLKHESRDDDTNQHE